MFVSIDVLSKLVTRIFLLSEMHEQRMTKLRQELERISQDQWKYKPIDKLIGF